MSDEEDILALTEDNLDAARRYTYEVWWSEEDRAFLARAEELIGVQSHGATPEEALAMTTEAAAGMIVVLGELNREIPAPTGTRRLIDTRAIQFAAPAPLTKEQVRAVRVQLGVSQAVFAQALGVDAGTVRSWE
ncbi:MAG: hypothetical protein H0W06_06860, partial [Chloroflexia bacterium]|nr:hypothetical protein [Chloroflexia bacterium]